MADHAAADGAWQRAEEILTSLGHADAGQVTAKRATLGRTERAHP